MAGLREEKQIEIIAAMRTGTDKILCRLFLCLSFPLGYHLFLYDPR